PVHNASETCQYRYAFLVMSGNTVVIATVFPLSGEAAILS
ncbi:MAG: hypothetical protein ACJARK_001225, partial [Marinobacter psychrophilus]